MSKHTALVPVDAADAGRAGRSGAGRAPEGLVIRHHEGPHGADSSAFGEMRSLASLPGVACGR